MSFKEILNSLSDDPNIRTLTEEESAKLKRILLENYLYIQEFCNKHNLSIMLVGGSALGAVRHKGFIPWDDDLDAAMPRKDFDAFKDIFEKELGDRYILDAPNTGKRSSNRFPKILIRNTRLVELGMAEDAENACIKIDLFIIENVPQSRFIRGVHGLICTAVMYIAGQVDSYEEQSELFKRFMYKTARGKKEYNKRIRVGKIFSFKPAFKWFNMVDNVCRYKKETDLMGIPTGRKHYFGEILPAKAFIPVSHGCFENNNVNIPGDVDAYLKNLYGDYMIIPKEKDREKHFIYEISFCE